MSQRLSQMPRRGIIIGMLVVVVLVCLPRFNQNDWFVGGLTGTSSINLADAGRYVDVADFISGDGVSEQDLLSPFDDRLLVPALAAALPMQALTGINVVNVLALMAGTWAVFRTVEVLQAKQRGPTDRTLTGPTLAATLFAVSFPVFFYGSIGYVDPTVVGLLSLGLLATVQRRWRVVVAIVVVSAFVKESAAAAAAPAAVMYAIDRGKGNGKQIVAFVAALGAAAVLSLIVSRILINAGASASWDPSIDRLSANLARPRSLIAVVLSLGLPALLCAAALITNRSGVHSLRSRPEFAALVAGSAVAGAQLLIAFFSAFLDGRMIWPATVYLSVLAAWLWCSTPETGAIGDSQRLSNSAHQA